eukprot:6492799-Amphidinium_carterae.10
MKVSASLMSHGTGGSSCGYCSQVSQVTSDAKASLDGRCSAYTVATHMAGVWDDVLVDDEPVAADNPWEHELQEEVFNAIIAAFHRHERVAVDSAYKILSMLKFVAVAFLS